MHKKYLFFNNFGLPAVPKLFHKPVAELPEFAEIFGEIFFHTVVYPVDTNAETAAFIKVYHKFSVVGGNISVGKKSVRVNRHNMFADGHQRTLENVAICGIINMEDRFFIIRRKFHGDRNTLFNRPDSRKFLNYTLGVLCDDFQEQSRNIFIMIIKILMTIYSPEKLNAL